MTWTVSVYMLYCLGRRAHHLDRQNIIKILGWPVLLGCRLYIYYRCRLLAAANLYAFFFKDRLDLRQKLFGNPGVHKHRLCSVAYRHILALRINRNPNGHIHIGRRINVDVADPLGVAEDGYICIVHNIAHEFIRAAGDNQVDIFIYGQHLRNILTRFQ